MLRYRNVLLVTAALAFALGSTEAAATAQRTFVASTGQDANACSLGAPCRSFGAAIAQTNAGGEIVVLDSAGYGAVAIAKSVSITAPSGVYAGISVLSGNGVTVNGAGVKVRLRGLQVNGQGGATGIYFQQGAELVVEDSTIANMGDNGIDVRAPNSFTEVSGCVIRSSVNSGIYADAFSGPVNLVVSRSRLEANQFGLFVRQGAQATLTDSLVTRNGLGVYVTVDNPAATTGSYISASATTIAKNGIGFSLADGGTPGPLPSYARLVDVVLTGNTTNDVQSVGSKSPGGNGVLMFAHVDMDGYLTLSNAVLDVRGSQLSGLIVCFDTFVYTKGDNGVNPPWPAACNATADPLR